VVNSLKELVGVDNLNNSQPCVGLICPSSEHFLFAWLGLTRAGFAVLLIAYVKISILTLLFSLKV